MKRLLPSVLQTRVARRLFLLFVMCALVPLGLIAALSLTQVRQLLLAQGDQRLSATAKGIGMVLFDRLTLAGDVAESTAASRDRAAEATMQRTFRSLVRWDAAGKPTVVTGTATPVEVPVNAIARVAQDRRTAFVVARGTGHDVFLVVPLRRQGEFAVGQLQPLFLWGPPDEVPHATDFCVVDDGTRAFLYCHAPGGEGSLRQFGAEPFDVARTGTWQRDGEAYRGRAWAQFLGGAFGAPDWTIVASQPESVPLARLVEFQQLYVPAVLLALLLVTWLTVRQSRHIVDPVERLARRARQIADGYFAGRLAMDRGDEFGELGHAFDGMSERLGRQFASLQALSEIDALILTTQDTTQVVRTVLKRLGDVAPADDLTLTLFDRDHADAAMTYFMGSADGAGFMADRHRLAPGEKSALEGDFAGRWVEGPAAERAPVHLAHAWAAGAVRAYVQPIVWRATAYGAMVLGYRQGAAASDEDLQRVRELADRVAVALSSAMRDEQLYQQTHFDSLTGAPNRLLFLDRPEVEIVRSQREERMFARPLHRPRPFQERERQLWPRHGRPGASRSGAPYHACDPRQRHARAPGRRRVRGADDEPHAPPGGMARGGERSIAGLSREFALGDERCFLSASVGIASFPNDAGDAGELLKRADTAMNRAKSEGRSQAMFFEERMNTEVVGAPHAGSRPAHGDRAGPAADALPAEVRRAA